MFQTKRHDPKAASGNQTDGFRVPADDEAMLGRRKTPLVIKHVADIYADWTDAELTRATLRLTPSERWAHVVLINVLHSYFREVPKTETSTGNLATILKEYILETAKAAEEKRTENG